MNTLQRSGSWYGDIARVISRQGRLDFAEVLCDWIRAVFPHDLVVLFGYRGPARPCIIYENFPAAHKDALEVYKNATYVLDPFSRQAWL